VADTINENSLEAGEAIRDGGVLRGEIFARRRCKNESTLQTDFFPCNNIRITSTENRITQRKKSYGNEFRLKPFRLLS
jgi:hypothetical protein